MIRNRSLTPDAVFSIFDIPSVIVPFKQRLIMINDLHLIGHYIREVQHTILYDAEDLLRFYQSCRRAGYEGAVIKPMDYKYKGSRSYDWMKMKEVLSVDLRVKKLFEGTGKYEGQMGGVVVEYNGREVKVGGGFSDYQRKSYWDEPMKIHACMIEVLYMEETDDGSLRHPRFVGFREDKE